MNWRRIMISPPPTTGWMLGSGRVAAIRRDPKDGGLRCVMENLPDGTCDVGPVGLQGVNRGELTSVLSAIQGRLEGAGRAAVVIPTGWVRSHLFDFDELPRRQSDIDQVVSWRLKKLLPVNPSDLRISSIPQPEVDGRRPLLCMVGVERAFADLESCFSSVGVVPGLIAPRVFALADSLLTGAVLVVQQEVDYLSLILMMEGAPRLLRTKPLATGKDIAPQVRSELQLAYRFIRDDIGVTTDIQVVVSAQSEPIQLELEQWWSAQDGVTLSNTGPLPVFEDQTVVETLGAAWIAPVLQVLDGTNP